MFVWPQNFDNINKTETSCTDRAVVNCKMFTERQKNCIKNDDRSK